MSRIDPTADEKTRTFGVELTVANSGGRLRSGMVATLQLPDGFADRASVLVPLASIVRAPGEADAYGGVGDEIRYRHGR